MEIYRQGDVLIVKVENVAGESVPRDEGRVILAYGEVTGHAHAIEDEECELTKTYQGDEFLRVLKEGGVDLTHEEHDTIRLPKGDYKIVHQREFDSKYGERSVAD